MYQSILTMYDLPVSLCIYLKSLGKLLNSAKKKKNTLRMLFQNSKPGMFHSLSKGDHSYDDEDNSRREDLRVKKLSLLCLSLDDNCMLSFVYKKDEI